MPLVGHPYRGELTRPQQLRQVLCIASVGLHLLARLLGDQRRRHHHAVVTEVRDQPVQAVAGGARLVAEGQSLVLGRQPGHQLAYRRLGGIDLALVAHLAPPASFRDRHRVAQLRRIDPHESFAMMCHDSPSLCEALPGQPG